MRPSEIPVEKLRKRMASGAWHSTSLMRFDRLRLLFVECKCRVMWNDAVLALHGCKFVKRVC